MPNQEAFENHILNSAKEKFLEQADKGNVSVDEPIYRQWARAYVEQELASQNTTDFDEARWVTTRMDKRIFDGIIYLFAGLDDIDEKKHVVKRQEGTSLKSYPRGKYCANFESFLACILAKTILQATAMPNLGRNKSEGLDVEPVTPSALVNVAVRTAMSALTTYVLQKDKKKQYDTLYNRMYSRTLSVAAARAVVNNRFLPEYKTLQEWTTTNSELSTIMYYIFRKFKDLGLVNTVLKANRNRSSSIPETFVDLAPSVAAYRGELMKYKYDSISRGGFLIEPPKPYVFDKLVGNWLGGYHTKGMQYTHPLFRSTAQVKTNTAALKQNVDFINKLQQQPWKLNTKIVDIMKAVLNPESTTLGQDREDYFGIPAYKDVDEKDYSPERTHNQGENEKAKLNLDVLRYMVNEVELAYSYMAKKDDPIYFSWKYDARGRLYPLIYTVSPQGTSISKAMLMFGQGQELDYNGLQAVKRMIAKILGYDKMSNEAKIVEFDKVEHQVLDIGEDLYNGSLRPRHIELWKGKEALWVFAYAHEYYLFMEKGKLTFDLPSSIDGTCNGLQHIAAITSDERLAKSVNLISEEDQEKPSDIYTECVDEAKKLLRLRPESMIDSLVHSMKLELLTDEEYLYEALDFWESQPLSRKLAKTAVMITPYNAHTTTKFEAIIKSVYEEFRGIMPDKKMTGLNYAVVLANIILMACTSVTRAATEMYMQSVVKAVGAVKDATLPLYTTPLGLKVYSPRKLQYKEHSIKRGDIYIPRFLYTPSGNKVDTKKLRTSTPPNIIHSLDSCHMIMAINKLWEEEPNANVWLIHDDYGTDPNSLKILEETTRTAFHELHSNYKLNTILKPKVEEESYTVGGFDLDAVLQSKFIFH